MLNVVVENYTKQNGVYSCVKLDQNSLKKVSTFLHKIGLPDEIFKDCDFEHEAHVTVVYSKKSSIDVINDALFSDMDVVALSSKFEYWDGHDNDGYLVLKLISKPCEVLNEFLVNEGAEHSFRKYHPHMTVVDKISSVDKSLIQEWIDKANNMLKFNPLLLKFDTLMFQDCKK